MSKPVSATEWYELTEEETDGYTRTGKMVRRKRRRYRQKEGPGDFLYCNRRGEPVHQHACRGYACGLARGCPDFVKFLFTQGGSKQ